VTQPTLKHSNKVGGRIKRAKGFNEANYQQWELSEMKQQDFEDEIENRQFAMFWDSLDIAECKWAYLKMFCLRFAIIMTQIHLMKHPDEIQQGKEIAYKILNGQSIFNINGVQSLSTWEWWKGYSLRTFLYPIWLSIPGFILKTLGLDTNFLVINSIYFMHCIIWSIGDYYCFLFVRQLLGKREAIMTLLYSLTSEHVNDYVLRTSANSVEGNLMFVVFYHYLNLKP